jgi:hypothetical protein
MFYRAATARERETSQYRQTQAFLIRRLSFILSLTTTHSFPYNTYMENEQTKQLTVKPKTSKTPILSIVAFLASLVSFFVFVGTVPFIQFYPSSLGTPHLNITASIAFALSITSLSRVFSRSVKWRSSEFVWSLLATIISGLILIPLLFEAIGTCYLYYRG